MKKKLENFTEDKNNTIAFAMDRQPNTMFTAVLSICLRGSIDICEIPTAGAISYGV